MRYRKRFGQNFLTDDLVIAKILSSVGLDERDSVIEIGPGSGAITSGLYDVAKEDYRAIEIDRDLIKVLQAKYPNLKLINEDVLQVDFDELLGDKSHFRILGNLPYNITTPILFKLIGLGDRFKIRDLHFMVQKEMADRLTATPSTKSWGRLSVLIQIHFDIESLFDVAPSSFSPEPKVWSSFVKLVPKENFLDQDKMELLDQVLKTAFSGRRKTIRNSLKSFDIDWQEIEVDTTRRADDLGIQDYLRVLDSVGGT